MGSPREVLLSHATAFAALIAVFTGLAAFLASLNLFGGSLGLLLTGGNHSDVNSASCFFAVACAALTFLTVRQALRNSFSLWFLRALVIMYFAALIWVELFKSVGVCDINFDISDVISQVRLAPESLLANILMFVPLGVLVRKRSARTWAMLAAGLGIPLAFEIAQYVLSLGILDVVDIAANFLGTIAGFALADALAGWGARLEPAVGGRVRFARARHLPETVDVRHTGIRALACVGLCVVGIVAFAIVRSLAPSAQREVALPPFSPSTTLAALSTTEVEAPSPDEIAKLPGATASENDVILNGLALGSVTWTSDDGTRCQGVDVLIEETLPNGIRRSHTLPAVLTESSKVRINNRDASFNEVVQLFAESAWWSATLTVSCEANWLRIDDLHLHEHQDLSEESVSASFPWDSYDSIMFANDSERVSELVDDGTAQVHGYVTTLFSPKEGQASMVLCVPQRLLGAPSLSSYQVGLEKGNEPQAESAGTADDLAPFRLRLEDEQLMLAE